MISWVLCLVIYFYIMQDYFPLRIFFFLFIHCLSSCFCAPVFFLFVSSLVQAKITVKPDKMSISTYFFLIYWLFDFYFLFCHLEISIRRQMNLISILLLPLILREIFFKYRYTFYHLLDLNEIRVGQFLWDWYTNLYFESEQIAVLSNNQLQMKIRL